MNVSLKKLTDILTRLQAQINALSGGGVQSVVAGTNVSVDNTDPANPVVSAASGGPAFDPVSLFSGGVDGALFDASDLSTLFQDTAGTVPVTAAGQSVALWKDKSGNGHHASQATAANRPTLAVDLLGNYALAFTGTQYLDCGTGFNANVFCALAAFNCTGVASASYRVLDSRGSGSLGTLQGWYVKPWNPTGTDGFVVDSGTAFLASSHTCASGVTHVGYFDHFTASKLHYQLDGGVTAVVSGSALGSVASTKTSRIGAASNDASQGFVGNIYAASVVKGKTLSSQTSSFLQWLADRCGVVL